MNYSLMACFSPQFSGLCMGHRACRCSDMACCVGEETNQRWNSMAGSTPNPKVYQSSKAKTKIEAGWCRRHADHSVANPGYAEAEALQKTSASYNAILVRHKYPDMPRPPKDMEVFYK